MHWIPILALVVALVGCGPAQDDAPAGNEDDGASKRPRSGGTITFAINAEPPSLSPVMPSTRVSTFVMGMMHFGLVRMQADGTWGPGIAESWEWSEDGTQLTMKLRDDLKWSDGDPMDSADVVATYELVAAEDSPFPAKNLLEPLADIDAPDPGTLVFTFADRPLDPLLSAVVNPLPSHVMGDLRPAEVESWPRSRDPLTVGPFRLAEWNAGESLRLERNPHYPGRPAYFEEVIVKVVPDPGVQLLQLEAGEVDVVQSVPFGEVERLEKNDDIRLHPIEGSTMTFLLHNLTRPALQDARVRRAISFGVDRQAMVDGLLYGFGQPAASAIAPIFPSHDGSVQPDPHDPVRAAELLTEAGWVDTDGDSIRDKDGVSLSLVLLTRAGDAV
ncbi:MAG: hypothetical protein HKO53_00335, partial [Gemmatimonadetes bacterium]|nr:hypothetical protein [Gemmatimonadota bacterium]